jgi:uncharacterized membrane protein YdbT with pleckstrin-like domain
MQSQAYSDDLIWKRASLPNKINDTEDILVVCREDLIILVGKALVLFLVFFVLMAFRVILMGVLDSFFLSLFDGFMFGVNVVLLTYFTLIFHNYYLSIQIITSERLIDIDQRGLFAREVNTLPINNIQDVTYKQNGLAGTVFNYGNVIVQTAGEQGINSNSQISGFVFDNIPDPATLASRLVDLYQDNRTGDVQETARANAEALKDVLNQDQPKPVK